MADSFMKRHLNVTMVISAVLAILGIYMMFQGQSFAKAFVALLGLGMSVSGINSLATMRVFALGPRNRGAMLFKGIVNIIIGVLVIALSLFTQNFSLHILLYILGAQLAISAIIGFAQAFLLRKGNISVASLVSEALFSLILAILFFAFPTQIGSMLLKLVGAILLVFGLALFVWAMRIRKLTKEFGSSTIEGEAVVIESSDKDDH